MAAAKPTVEIIGLKKLLGKLDRVPQAVQPLMESAVKYAEKEAKAGFKPHPGDKGTLAKVVKRELAPGVVPLSAKVVAGGQARLIEEGAAPGRIQGVTRQAEWAHTHGGIRNSVWALAMHIKKRGTKGIFAMKKAAEKTREKLPELVKDAAKSIEKDWSK